MSRRITIKDVAREAGVSIATVSNAINNVDVLTTKTKEHVLEVASRMNYIPNQNGQGLRFKETKAIGLFVSEMTGSYYGILADTMHWACHKYGYELYIYITNQCETIVNTILGHRVDGAVILYEGVLDKTLEMLVESGSPVVFIDREIKHEKIGSVIFDSFGCGKMAAEYLLSLGHKNLMHIFGPEDNYDSIERFKGFKHAIQKAGGEFQQSMLLKGGFERDMAFLATKRYLQSGQPLPDAVFASNDQSAIGCCRALRDANIRVPEDISVIGCDDVELCELLDPPLTTIGTNFQNQGNIAIDTLMEMMKKNNTGEIVKIESRLKIRKSCAKKETGAQEEISQK